jgi:SAM-dependent methyltransferase
MASNDPIDLLFGGMDKLGPGGDAYTRRALQLLPHRSFDVVVDAGCGTGRQTLVLTKELDTPIHAIDTHEPFLNELALRAEKAGLAQLIRPRLMDMKDIPDVFSQIDLLWSEGAAYNIGFENALNDWSRAIRPAGFLVVSELVWLSDHAPAAARDFFQSAYPAMQDTARNIASAGNAGYRVLDTYTLPRQAWIEG